MKNFGFSLIELLVVITLIGIMTMIAVPSYMKFYRQTNLKNAIDEVRSGLNEAFSYARSHSKHVYMSGAVDSKTFLVEAETCDENNICVRESLKDFEDILFKGNVSIQTDFEIKFLAPYGNIEYTDTGHAEDILEKIKIANTDAEQSLKIYKKSGLVEILPYTPL